MASTIDDAKIILIDTFGEGIGDNMVPFPSDMTQYTDTALFPLGTTRRVYDETHKGFAVFRYLKVTGGTDGNANGMAAKSICGLVATAAAAGTAGWPFTVTPDGGEALLNGPIAVALGAVTGAVFTAKTSMYGWFWTGGVCPTDYVAGLDGNYVTDGNVAAGAGMDLVDGGGCQFGVVAAADVALVSAFAGAADA